MFGPPFFPTLTGRGPSVPRTCIRDPTLKISSKWDLVTVIWAMTGRSEINRARNSSGITRRETREFVFMGGHHPLLVGDGQTVLFRLLKVKGTSRHYFSPGVKNDNPWSQAVVGKTI